MSLIRLTQFIPSTFIAAVLALSAAAPCPAAAQDKKPAAPAKPAAPKPAPAPAPAAAANPTAQATLLGQFGDWGAYTATPGGRKVCFALAKPALSQDNPPNRRAATNAVYMFVSSRPAEKVKDEVSMLVSGYALKADASLSVGSTPFVMYTQNDGAWVKNAADEVKLVAAMRTGSDLVVKAMTSRGTQTTDTFSLKGVGQALDRVAQECK